MLFRSVGSRGIVSRIAASACASGTRIMWSMTCGRNDGSTRGRPMPSMRDGVAQEGGIRQLVWLQGLKLWHLDLGDLASLEDEGGHLRAGRLGGTPGARLD